MRLNIKTILPVIIFLTAFIFTSCQEEKHPPTSVLNKDGSVEIVFETMHLGDTLDVLKTIKRVYVQNQVVKEFINSDTLPSLGTVAKQAENEAGDVQNILVPKDYELFVTIK